MTTEQFLDRLIPPGAFIAIAYKPSVGGAGMMHRFFQRSDVHGAAGFIRWCGAKGLDVWHANASFAAATLVTGAAGRQNYQGERTQANVEALKALWLDVDISRPGDGKDPTKVFADLPTAVAWCRTFLAATNIPPPNLWVSSGYGMHLYWVTEDPMDPGTWKPYAEALKAAVMQHQGYGCDLAVVGDSARLLRPPGSFNMKVPTAPMPVSVVTSQSRSDYPNAMLYAVLQPYLGQIAAGAPAGAAAPSMGALAGAGPTVPGHTSTMAAAASRKAELPKDKSLALIATKCLQVSQSLTARGAGDPYPLWYLGHLSLAHHCNDGAAMAHELSDGHAKYVAAAVDAAIARVAREKGTHDTGPPRCTSYNQYRPGVCLSCPFWGKVLSPWNLGAVDGDLPKNYRRSNGRIQHATAGKDGLEWVDVAPGDVHSPALTFFRNSPSLAFTYEFAGRAFPVSAARITILPDVGSQIRLWGEQGVAVNRYTAVPFGDFIVAWIDTLREQNAARTTVAEPFGWAENPDGSVVGLAIAGELHRADGSTEIIAGGDQVLNDSFTPRGHLQKWQDAAKFVLTNRPDLQVLVAASMGAPLMRFTGEPGIVLNFYSRDSAVGKSSACKVAHTVWGNLSTMSVLDDTNNQMRAKIGAGRVIPLVWDELRMDKENSREVINLLFSISQGKDKGRLGADARMKPIGEWRTIMITTGNSPLMSYVTARTGGTDAGAVRLMEFDIGAQKIPLVTSAGSVVEECTRGVGRAGALLACYYAQHATEMHARVQAWMQRLGTAMQSQPNERFYIAGVACVMAAAQVAGEIGLLTFDFGGMLKFIKANWSRLRADREFLVVNNGKLNLIDLFNEMFAELRPFTVKTSMFAARGVKNPKFKILEAPLRDKDTAKGHISVDDRVLRIDYKWFDKWCRERGPASADVLKAMERLWGARTDRAVLGAGTPWSAAQVRFIEVPLRHPDLVEHDPGDQTIAPPGSPAAARQSMAQTVGAVP